MRLPRLVSSASSGLLIRNYHGEAYDASVRRTNLTTSPHEIERRCCLPLPNERSIRVERHIVFLSGTPGGSTRLAQATPCMQSLLPTGWWYRNNFQQCELTP